DEDVEQVGPPGRNRRGRGKDAAERLPPTPAAAIKPSVPWLVVLAAGHHVDPVGPPGYRRWFGGDDAPKRFPSAPVRAIEHSMPELVVLAPDEHIGSVRSGSRHGRAGAKDAAKQLPGRRKLYREHAPQLGGVAVVSERPHPGASQIVGINEVVFDAK